MPKNVFRHPTATEKDDAGLVHQSLRVLLVADETGNACTLRLAFRANGLPAEIYRAPDSRTALHYLHSTLPPGNSTLRPDLIVLDLALPGPRDFDVLARIKSDRDLCAIPVVMVSASFLDTDLRAAYRLGVAGCVQRPIALEDLYAAVRILGDYWFKSVRLPHNER